MAERIKQIPKKLLEIWNNWTKKQKTVIVSAVAVGKYIRMKKMPWRHLPATKNAPGSTWNCGCRGAASIN